MLPTETPRGAKNAQRVTFSGDIFKLMAGPSTKHKIKTRYPYLNIRASIFSLFRPISIKLITMSARIAKAIIINKI